MLISDLLRWWYFNGFAWVGHRLFIERTQKIVQFFSVSDLLRTLFAPFRQDAVDTKGAPLGIKLQSAGMNAVSRVIGFMIRSVLLAVALLVLVINMLLAVVILVIWPVVPAIPILAVILSISEVRTI